jgi:hypothetical protein
MFGLQSSSFSQIQTAFSDLASLVSWEIAYTPAMSDASITVTNADGVLVLEGRASRPAIQLATEIAERLFGGHVCNLISAD